METGAQRSQTVWSGAAKPGSDGVGAGTGPLDSQAKALVTGPGQRDQLPSERDEDVRERLS